MYVMAVVRTCTYLPHVELHKCADETDVDSHKVSVRTRYRKGRERQRERENYCFTFLMNKHYKRIDIVALL